MGTSSGGGAAGAPSRSGVSPPVLARSSFYCCGAAGRPLSAQRVAVGYTEIGPPVQRRHVIEPSVASSVPNISDCRPLQGHPVQQIVELQVHSLSTVGRLHNLGRWTPVNGPRSKTSPGRAAHRPTSVASCGSRCWRTSSTGTPARAPSPLRCRSAAAALTPRMSGVTTSFRPPRFLNVIGMLDRISSRRGFLGDVVLLGPRAPPVPWGARF